MHAEPAVAASAPGAGPAQARLTASRRRRGRLVRLLIGALAAAVGLTCLIRPPGPVALVELKLLDWHAQLRGPLPPPPGITVVSIDEPSLARIGHWPWPRTRTAEIIERLTAGGARVIALDLLLNEPDRNSRLALAEGLAERYRALGLRDRGGPAARFGEALERARADADTDGRLAAAIEAARRVVLPYFFIFPPSAPSEGSPLDDESRRLLNRSRLVAFSSAEAAGALEPRRANGVLLPLARLQAVAAGAGHANVLPDADGALRRFELAIQLDDGLYPSLMLETARQALGVSRTRVRLTTEQELHLDTRVVPTDENGTMHLSYYGRAGTFPTLSAADVLLGAAPPAVRDHVVLVGFTAHGLMDVRSTPFDSVMPGVEIHATALGNLLEGRGLRRLAALVVVEAAAVVALALVVPFVLPRLGPIGGTVLALAVALGLGAAAHGAFRAGTLVTLLPLLSALLVAHVGGVTYQVLTEERERRWIKHAFAQYVPPALVDRIGKDPEALAFGGSRRTLTVMFTDIRGFTTFSERNPPEVVVATMQEYLTAMVDIIFRHRGTLDKFIGDAIMAFFGAPFDNPDHAAQACRAAVEMSEALERLNERWREEGREPLTHGIGIATGEVVVGNFGASQRFSYTVIGDHVNLAARLESLNKDYPTRRHVIISDATYAQARDEVVARPIGTVNVKGKLQAVEIYELVDVKPEAPAGGQETRA
jgi:adenylate cyclase